MNTNAIDLTYFKKATEIEISQVIDKMKSKMTSEWDEILQN